MRHFKWVSAIFFCSFVTTVSLASAPGSSPAMNPEDNPDVVVIGIIGTVYENMFNLQQTALDPGAIGEALENTGSEVEVEIIDTSEIQTEEEVIDTISNTISGVPEGTQIVMVVSGHGETVDGEFVFPLPNTWGGGPEGGDPQDGDALDCGEFAELVGGLPVTMIIDTCYAGAMDPIDGVTMYTACDDDEIAVGGSADTCSIFTQYLVEAIEGSGGLPVTTSEWNQLHENVDYYEMDPQLIHPGDLP